MQNVTQNVFGATSAILLDESTHTYGESHTKYHIHEIIIERATNVWEVDRLWIQAWFIYMSTITFGIQLLIWCGSVPVQVSNRRKNIPSITFKLVVLCFFNCCYSCTGDFQSCLGQQVLKNIIFSLCKIQMAPGICRMFWWNKILLNDEKSTQYSLSRMISPPREQFNYLDLNKEQYLRPPAIKAVPLSGARITLPIINSMTIPMGLYVLHSISAEASDICNLSKFACHLHVRKVIETILNMLLPACWGASGIVST